MNKAALTLPTHTAATLRKRTPAPKLSPAHGTVKYSLLRDLDGGGEGESKGKPVVMSKKSKVYPFKNAEEFASVRSYSFDKRSYSLDKRSYSSDKRSYSFEKPSYSFDKRSSSRDSSDYEFECRQRQKVSVKNEEKSQLICFKDDSKLIAIKNDSKLTKYNTFDMKYSKRGKMTKYKSLDEPESKTVVKYLDRCSNISISAQDFDSDFKLLKYDSKKGKHDIICDTVDAWARKGNKGVFANLKHSLFKSGGHHPPDKEVVYKPLVFGGTFPIDCPTNQTAAELKAAEAARSRTERLGKEKAVSDPSVNKDGLSFLNRPPKMRAYGPAKSFDIDRPI